MNALLVSDLHLTANPRDEYRWALWPWLRETCRTHSVKSLVILGDLTEAKDYHSARLVNRVADETVHTYRDGGLLEIIILRGNHDGLDPNCPYFQFLRHLPFVHYYATPFQKPISGQEVLFLPHTRDPLNAWQSVEMHSADVILMHATVRGSLAENGQALEGIPPGLLHTARRAKTIYSGDVHVPQRVGKVEYVGAPYPVRFGDSYQGRAILLKDWRTPQSLPIPSIQRVVVTMDSTSTGAMTAKRVRKGDQVKVRVQLAPHEYGEWNRIKADVRAIADAIGCEICGIELDRADTKPLGKLPIRKPTLRTPQQVLADYCRANKVDTELTATGQEILEASK